MTIAVGQHLGTMLTAGDVVLLYGQLGAGKTHFSKGLVAGCGSTDSVTSPTFVFINEYRSANRTPIFHVDLYRITSPEELYTIGLDDATSGVGICIIEWPERDASLAHMPHLAVYIDHNGVASRHIHLIGYGERAGALCRSMQQSWPVASPPTENTQL